VAYHTRSYWHCFRVLDIVTIIESCLFFSCYDHHRDLHSFPTRRSSDLGRPPSLEPPRQDGRGRSRCAEGGELPCPPPSSPPPGRSEEHTSELQSRENLVCRLLLEKKKISI